MGDLAIRVEGLAKQYRIGERVAPYLTLRDVVSEWGARVAGLASGGGRRQRKATWIWALQDVSFDVHQGEVLGVIGPNGAGKSTLLKILSRVTDPSRGRAVICGRVGSLLEVGTGFHPELTGRENVFLNGAILGMRKAEIQRQFDKMVAFAEVERFIDTPVKWFSSGMYLRLAFAVAAHLEPEILLVDEVLAVGDAKFQKKCLGKMGDVAREGRTVLFVSHNMAAVRRLCQRAILLEEGRIAHEGPVHEVIGKYRNVELQQAGERVWTNPARAPGNEVVRLRAVRALTAEGRVASRFHVTDPLSLEVEFSVLVPGYQLDASVYCYNEAGALIFLAGDFQDPTWQGRQRPVGIHRSRCHIPGNLLNEGPVSVLAGISTNPHTLHAVERDAIMFELVDDLQPGGARGGYTRPWPGGVVRPLLQWSFLYTPADEAVPAAAPQPVGPR